MKKYRKILSGILIISMFVSCATSNVLAANTNESDGGAMLREMYESSIAAESENSLPTAQEIKEDEADAQGVYLDAIMKVNVDYSQYYGGAYLDNGELVVLLTDTSNAVKSFVNNAIGSVPRYEKCDVSLQELKAIKELIVNYWDSYVEGTNEELNEMVESIVSVGTYIDENSIFVGIVDCTEEKERLFRENIIDSRYILFENSDIIRDQSNSLNPGHAIGIGTSTRATHSMGFRCRKLLSSGNYAYGFVTSAHGTELSSPVYYTGGGQIGYVYSRSWVNGGNTDAAFVCVTNSDYACSNSTFYRARNCSTYVQIVLKGKTVYLEGQVTQYDDGSIEATDVHVTTSGIRINDLYKTTYNCASGDSGGIVYKKFEETTNYGTIGIHKGGDGIYGYVVKINNILNDLNVMWY